MVMPTINTENRNQYALITGATSGIGYELAKLFARDGFNLILIARNDELLQQTSDELKQQYGVEITPLAKDLFDRNAAEQIYNKTKEMGITVNVL
jgi:short-subunit dehydrogenase